MTEPLFEVGASDADREHQACDCCCVAAWASSDALYVRGWIVYDGKSLTGKPLKVRICPACRRAPKEKP
jgi:hypothetical protein